MGRASGSVGARRRKIRAWLKEGLEGLDHDARRAVQLRYVEGKDLADIARTLGLSVRELRTLMQEANRSLQTALVELAGAETPPVLSVALPLLAASPIKRQGFLTTRDGPSPRSSPTSSTRWRLLWFAILIAAIGGGLFFFDGEESPPPAQQGSPDLQVARDTIPHDRSDDSEPTTAGTSITHHPQPTWPPMSSGSLTVIVTNPDGELCRDSLTLALGARPRGLGSPLLPQTMTTRMGRAIFTHARVGIPLRLVVKVDGDYRDPTSIDPPPLEHAGAAVTVRVILGPPHPLLLAHIADDQGNPMPEGRALSISLLPSKRVGSAAGFQKREVRTGPSGLIRIPMDTECHLECLWSLHIRAHIADADSSITIPIRGPIPPAGLDLGSLQLR